MGSPVTGINYHLLLAIWTLIIAFGLNWMYVHADGSLKPRHPLTYSFPVLMQWLLLHNPLLANLLAGGQVAVAGNTTLSEGGNSALGHNGSNRSDQFTMEHSWRLCGSLSLSVFILYYFAQLAGSVEPDGRLVFPKQVRLIMRPIIGLVLLFLPFAHDSLSFVKTLSIIMGLVIFCVTWEVATSLQRGGRFANRGQRDSNHQDLNSFICPVSLSSSHKSSRAISILGYNYDTQILHNQYA